MIAPVDHCLTEADMIDYDLTCRQGHIFEGWFEDASAFQTQKKKGLLTCPVCGSADVSRLPSTFAIKNRPHDRRSALNTAKTNFEALGRQIQDYVEKKFRRCRFRFRQGSA